MARRKIRSDHEGQLGLALTGREGFDGPSEARGLLSLAYVTRHLKESSDFPSADEVATLAMSAKRHEFDNTAPANELVARVREIGEALRLHGPAYLKPSAQGKLLATPADCLEVIEQAVNWEAEKLYGVEGLGPFDEF